MDFNSYHSYKQNGTLTTRVVCAVCFCVFSFLWLFEFQADVLAVAQHVLSGGVTSYNPFIGAVLITVVLFLIQLIVAAFTGLYRRAHALTYLPSMLILAFLSSVNSDIDQHISLCFWLWMAPLALLLWGGIVWAARLVLPYENASRNGTGFFSQRTWINLFQMAVMMLGVAMLSNTNAVFHYSAHAEVALNKGDVDGALRVGQRSLETNERLTMLRVYALSLKHELGDKLFHYPVVGTRDDMLPVNHPPQLLPADTIWKHLGGRPASPMSSEVFYQLLEQNSLATAAVADYRLCGYLIDRDLDAFVRQLPRYYEVADSLPLPRHYQEALVLYRHIRTNPAIVYHHPVIDEDWSDLQKLEAAYPLSTERHFKVFDRYRESYWYYYYYKQ